MKKFSVVIGTLILLMILGTASITIVTHASSEGQNLAPGQWDQNCGDDSSCNHNPSGGFTPPGNKEDTEDMNNANPGQCQKLYNEAFDNGHDFAHDICIN